VHALTRTALLQRIRDEVWNPPSGRVYAAKSAAEICDMLGERYTPSSPPTYRDVLISDVRGYLEARLVLVRLEDWWPGAAPGDARDAARTLLRVTSSDQLKNFTTSTPSGRANIFGLFALLVAAGAGGLTQQHYDEIVAMAVVPAPAEELPPRWESIIDGLSAEPGHPGPPNTPDLALVEEALAS
jgi:hypothetical protein